MNGIFGIIRYTLLEQFRHRVYLSLSLFGVVLLAGSLVVSSLAMDEKMRMLLNLGLAGTEFLALITIVFVTVTLVLGEIENRTIYLLLSRPVPRWHYLLGRYLGTLIAIAIAMTVMGLFHVGLMLLQGWTWDPLYLVAWLCSFAKIATVGSLALFFSLFSTSAASSMTFTLFFWVLGHFSEELRFLAEKAVNPVAKGSMMLFYYLAPNFTFFTVRDLWNAPQWPPNEWFLWLVLYAVGYSAACFWLSAQLFERKEV